MLQDTLEQYSYSLISAEAVILSDYVISMAGYQESQRSLNVSDSLSARSPNQLELWHYDINLEVRTQCHKSIRFWGWARMYMSLGPLAC